MNDKTPFSLPGLKGQRIVITAGAGGIGLATARLLHSAGAQVAICDVDADALKAAGRALGDCLALQADVSQSEEVDAFFAAAGARMGGLDALINNAGIAGPTGAVEDISEADWRACIDVCLTGQFLCARRAVPLLKAAGGGSIVCMSSAAGKHGYSYRTPYSAAKFGVIGLTQSLAKELGPHNIRVNAILPGLVAGPRIDRVIRDRAEASGVPLEEMTSEYLSKVSLRRMVTSEDVAGTIAFLLSDAGRNLSGQSLGVDGNVEVL
ncbi:SDR family oxidoreductase [Roseobacter ponti]|uniref:SDR family oxidoreductase n=1 Tax=Roseobacter ponti TaxID=1891787 RepID=A0A858SXN6_9RHOB|nr:SDR family oxidoreductase [Roseobacter ponti]QJF51636.1 SDR family oxidoreductase [Roseobacter ponti]